MEKKLKDLKILINEYTCIVEELKAKFDTHQLITSKIVEISHKFEFKIKSLPGIIESSAMNKESTPLVYEVHKLHNVGKEIIYSLVEMILCLEKFDNEVNSKQGIIKLDEYCDRLDEALLSLFQGGPRILGFKKIAHFDLSIELSRFFWC